MKHASDVALDTIEPMLSELRRVESIRERKRGLFYRRSSAFITLMKIQREFSRTCGETANGSDCQ